MNRFPSVFATVGRMSAPSILLLSIAWTAGVPGISEVHAQEVDWDVEGEVGASVFFGNTSQSTFNAGLSTSRADSVYEFSTRTSFSYSEAEDSEGNAFVAKRSWDAEASVDWHPFARLSPFGFGEAMSSFERRIDFRYSVGVGGKLTFVRSETSRFDFSTAVLAEQTFVRDDPDRVEEPDESVLARLSFRVRGRKELEDGRVILSSENFFRPVIGDYGNYVFESRSSVSYALSEIVSLRFSFLDTYDSRAEERGAETNNDGRILFSVLSTF